MTYNKIKISMFIAILSVSLTSIEFTQSFAQETFSQEDIRQKAIKEQTSLFSSNAQLGEKIPVEGFDRIISERDPGIGHENHQLAVIIPISEKEYTGTLYYSASEPVQLVSLRGPLEPGEDKGKFIWTTDGETHYEITLVNEYTTTGQWSFVGNALALHTFKNSPFVVDYKVDYEEVKSTRMMPRNSLNDINIITEFSFDSETIQINSFDVYQHVSGFNRETPVVNLQGMVGIDKSILYRAADEEFNRGTGPFGAEHKFSEFGMSIYLEQGDLPIRKMTYRECDITNYTIDTLNDKDYSYNKASVFVLVDNFEITCTGMQPYHYEYQKYIDEYGVEAVMKMHNMKMSPKTYKDYGID
ncbi:hypothetical protein [Nitrosopumilus piranensis]|uniref:Uncharacterized protein n=1 Tax=Nitrosopumilus piranensis TaxID=1582439 RepID=A0A0C5BS76_9ARCH|nr:hypothetical protein [Nitrosopumilus piranensis]AJM92598.1 conserved exported protein of unknown function [Nitrosopumilus piranensis]